MKNNELEPKTEMTAFVPPPVSTEEINWLALLKF